VAEKFHLSILRIEVTRASRGLSAIAELLVIYCQYCKPTHFLLIFWVRLTVRVRFRVRIRVRIRARVGVSVTYGWYYTIKSEYIYYILHYVRRFGGERFHSEFCVMLIVTEDICERWLALCRYGE